MTQRTLRDFWALRKLVAEHQGDGAEIIILERFRYQTRERKPLTQLEVEINDWNTDRGNEPYYGPGGSRERIAADEWDSNFDDPA